MATMTRAESKHMYSWWWDSHISPKNSRWLQENLTDMDAKVKLMIKLIEVDEDSFARRAEMYYKKRPELMKLVEEFYRAFRALAERYDHATGVIKQAHTTMAEAFPNQVPFLVSDDGSFSSPGDSSPFTPEMSVSVRAFCDHGNFHSEEINGPFASGEELSFSKVKKGLNFLDADEKEVQIQKNEISPQNAQVFSESERLGKSETDIQELKEALARLEAEKQAGMLEYEERLSRLSNLESEVSRAQEDSRGLHERASKAEAEVLSLKESLSKLEGERESCLHRYQQCLDRISNLESDVSRLREDAEKHDTQVSLAEKESQFLRKELVQLKAEKEAGLAKYMEALEKIANLENRLLLAEGKASVTFERAYNAEKEVATLKETLDRATKEKEAAAVQHQQCLEKIATLESEIALSLEEAARLKGEIDQGAAKLKGKEEQYHLLERSNTSMQRELDSLSNKLGVQNEELSEKQKELGRLWTCVQEERLRFVEVETAFRALQGLHSQTQEELRSVAVELQKRVQLLNDMGIHNQRLQDEVQKTRDENKTLSEHNLSSTVLQNNMQEEIFNLKEGKTKLEVELEIRSDERNAFQHEVYCLKEEINVLKKKHHAMLDQVEILGFQPECFGSSVKSLQDENSKLKESCQRSEAEISAVLEKLVVMEELIEKKAILEQSLSELSVQLEETRGRIKALEESYKLLMNEKSMAVAERATLSSQLDILTENLDKLSERNKLLENSLHDTNGELDALKKTSKSLEDSCQLLNDDKSILLSERQSLELKLETAQQRLVELGKRHEELEHKYSYIEDERQIALKLVEDLRTSLTEEKQRHETSARLRNVQMDEMEKTTRLLQDEGRCTRGRLEKELDQAVCSQFEIYILQNVLQDLKETNSSFLNKYDRLLETSKLSEELILELEYENIEQYQEVNFLSEQIKRLRMGMFELLKVLDVEMELVCEDNIDKDQMILHRILNKVDDTRSSLYKAWDENQKLLIEKSVLETLLGQLKQEVSDLKAVINTFHQEFRTGNDQLTSLQKGMHKLLQSHEQLNLAVEEGNHKDELFVAEVVNLKAKLLEVQSLCQDLEKENCGILEEKRSLVKTVTHLDDEKIKLEHDNSCLFVDAVTLDTLSLIFKNNVLERTEVIKQLTHSTCKLCDDNRVLEDKVQIMETMVEKYQVQNMNLKDSLENFDNELKEVSTANSQLRLEIARMKDQLSQKELEFSEAQAVKDDQGKQILELSEQYDQILKESESLRESMQNANAEVCRVLKNQKETDRRVEILRCELKNVKIEAELWETVAGTFFSEVQTSSVREALFREKFSELGREYECLVDENRSIDLEAVQLKERVGSLEGENGQIKAQLAGHIQALATLRQSVASLESHVMRTEFENDNDKDAYSASSHKHSTNEVVAASASDGISDLLDISTRIKAIESKMIETKRLAEERSRKLLKSQSSRSHRGSSGRSSRHIPSESMEEQPAARHYRHNTKQQKPASYPYEAGELLMKDIMLDQASEASSRWKNRSGGYNNSQSDDQILELWQTMDQAGSIDLTVGSHHQHLEAMKEINGSIKLDVDRVEISKTAPIEADTKRKILDRLASDVQKLTNLQITVQDLKQKVVITENSTPSPSKGKGSEYARIKEQLDEADRANAKLLDVNGKLMKKVETSSSIDDCFEAGQSGRTRRVSEQARRCSEKIGRLQLEVQKIQFVLVKLDGGNKTTGTRAPERNSRVLLKDYLYASSRTPRRRKKAHFCGCVHTSPISGD